MFDFPVSHSSPAAGRQRARALVCLAVAASLAWPGAAGAQQSFSDTTDVLVVEIPVQVIRDGEPVRGLSADDFEVIDGKKKRSLVGFEVVDLAAEAGPVEAAAPPLASVARRHFLLLFDLALSYPASIVKARQAARDLVERSMHPSDLVAVATYTSTRGAQLVLGFTSDRDQVALALETLGLPGLLQTGQDPLGIVYEDARNTRDTGRPTGAGAGAGNVGVDAEAEILEILERLETEAGRAQERNKIEALTGSLTELAGLLQAIDGSKHVVFLSEGFDSSILLGRGVDSAEEQQAIQRANEAAASGQVWEVRSDERFGNTSALNQLETMSQEFVRAGCTVQAVDIGGLRAGADERPRRPSDDGLYMMADQTGGEYYRNFNDLGQAMGKMLARTSVTYVLAIQADDVERDDKFRRLKVKVKDGGRNLQVNHRPGYFPPKALSQRSPLERRLVTADLVLGGREGGQVETWVLAASFPTGEGDAYVPVLIEIDGDSLLAGHSGDTVPTEIYAYALAADGSVLDFFTRALGFDLAKVEAGLRQSGFKYWGYFQLPPGSYRVRTVVRNAASGVTGVRSVPFRVSGGEAGGLELSMPFFPEPGGKWLLGRADGATDFAYPFLLGDQPFIPAARPVVPAGQAVPVQLVAHNLGAGGVGLLGRVLDAAGEPVEGAAMELEARAPGAVPGQDRLMARFSSGSLPSGSYTLEVTVRDEESGETQTSTIPIQIAS